MGLHFPGNTLQLLKRAAKKKHLLRQKKPNVSFVRVNIKCPTVRMAGPGVPAGWSNGENSRRLGGIVRTWQVGERQKTHREHGTAWMP